MNIQYETLPGDHIGKSAVAMVALANESRCEVHAEFNDIPLRAYPGDDPKSIESFYMTESSRRHEAYISTPEYKERQRQAEEAGRQKELALKDALAAAPKGMAMRDPVAWEKWVQANKDGYGNAIIQYADRWARLMELCLAKDPRVRIEDCAEQASHLADNEGITGFMYGAAVSMLSRVWVHGEELRRWHNKEYGQPDAKGTVNPAILTIGPKTQSHPE